MRKWMVIMLAGVILGGYLPSASAQWYDAGSYMYTADGVTVGATLQTPQRKLNVRDESAKTNVFLGSNGAANMNIAVLHAGSGDDLRMGADGRTGHLVITKDGDIGIGTTTPANKLDVVDGDIGLTNMDAILFEDGGGSYVQGMYMDSNSRMHIDNLSGAAAGVQIYTGADASKCSFDVIQGLAVAFSVMTGSASPANVKVWSLGSGTVYSNSGRLTNVNPSSLIYKEQIKPVDLKAERILDLEPKTFVWKESGKRDFGYIAEEVRETIPELYRDDGITQGYDESKLSFYLAEVVKAQEKRLAALEEEIRSLKSERSAE